MILVSSDPEGLLQQVTRADDLAYTYFNVAGDFVTTFERGLGHGSFDPDKVVLNR